MELVAAKRQRTDAGAVVVSAEARALQAVETGTVLRTSSLDAPTMLLTGHGDAVMSCKFAPSGAVLASGAADKTVSLWNVRGDCEQFRLMTGHKNAVLEVAWTPDGERVLSASADKSVRAWDAETGAALKAMREHNACVNAVCAARRGPPLLVSGSDDGTAKVWDLRSRRSVTTLTERFPVTAVAFADEGDAVFAAGLGNAIHSWDLRTGAVALTLAGHTDTVTGLALAADGTQLLSNGMDGALRVWDVRPFAPAERCVRVLKGATHNFEKLLLRCAWAPDGAKVSAGSADRQVYIWAADSGRLLYKLPGHRGSVNEVAFHPTEPIVTSCSSDKQIYLGELAN